MNEFENIPIPERPFYKEFVIQTSKSSGPGGQHVNKTESRIEIRFHVDSSMLLSEEEKQTIKEKLKNRISSEGFLLVSSQEHRSQLKNRETAEGIFIDIVSKALKKRKKRVATKPSRTTKEKRLQSKKSVSDKKTRRTKPGWEE